MRRLSKHTAILSTREIPLEDALTPEEQGVRHLERAFALFLVEQLEKEGVRVALQEADLFLLELALPVVLLLLHSAQSCLAVRGDTWTGWGSNLVFRGLMERGFSSSVEVIVATGTNGDTVHGDLFQIFIHFIHFL